MSGSEREQGKRGLGNGRVSLLRGKSWGPGWRCDQKGAPHAVPCHTQPPSASILPQASLRFTASQCPLQGRHSYAVQHIVSSFTRKPASAFLSSRTGSYAAQTVCAGHPYRGRGICPLSPDLAFQSEAVVEAPQLPRETRKEMGESAGSSSFSNPFSFLGLIL
jgi:hypothetical protein